MAPDATMTEKIEFKRETLHYDLGDGVILEWYVATPPSRDAKTEKERGDCVDRLKLVLHNDERSFGPFAVNLEHKCLLPDEYPWPDAPVRNVKLMFDEKKMTDWNAIERYMFLILQTVSAIDRLEFEKSQHPALNHFILAYWLQSAKPPNS